eukprot:PhM_4_TR18817/c0_g1_i1/m.35836
MYQNFPTFNSNQQQQQQQQQQRIILPHIKNNSFNLLRSIPTPTTSIDFRATMVRRVLCPVTRHPGGGAVSRSCETMNDKIRRKIVQQDKLQEKQNHHQHITHLLRDISAVRESLAKPQATLQNRLADLNRRAVELEALQRRLRNAGRDDDNNNNNNNNKQVFVVRSLKQIANERMRRLVSPSDREVAELDARIAQYTPNREEGILARQLLRKRTEQRVMAAIVDARNRTEVRQDSCRKHAEHCAQVLQRRRVTERGNEFIK